MKKPEITPENKSMEAPENKAAAAKKRASRKRNNSGKALGPDDKRGRKQ